LEQVSVRVFELRYYVETHWPYVFTPCGISNWKQKNLNKSAFTYFSFFISDQRSG
jgi:hypothetical protein